MEPTALGEPFGYPFYEARRVLVDVRDPRASSSTIEFGDPFAAARDLADQASEWKEMSKPACSPGAVPVVALLMIGTPAIADDPGPDWMSIEQAISVVKENGYSEISEIEADDGRWEGEGTKDGEPYEFHVNPQTGELTKDERDDD